VTGTKGKSTTATVIAHLLRQVTATELAGNIGRPVIELLDTRGHMVVCELSSYQIADLTIGPEVAVLTNLYREHTDWHGSEEQYRADKLRIFELPGSARRFARLATAAAGRWSWRRPDPAARATTTPRTSRRRWRRSRRGTCRCHRSHRRSRTHGASARLQTVAYREHGTEWIDDSISTTPESAIALSRPSATCRSC